MRAPRRLRRAGTVAGTTVILAGFAILLFGGIEENLVYFLTPTELIARGPDAVDVPLRLGGEVQPGSVEWNAQALDLRFVLTDGEGTVPVRSTGAPPQMFRDGMGVVVEGHFRSSGTFESHNLMVMHSNEYHPDPEDGPSPHGLLQSDGGGK